MDSRQQFEEWWLEGVYPLRRMDRLEDAGVSEEIAQEIWQASRESLVVELPFLFPHYKQDVVDTLANYGIRTK